jgi:hypothetical protein
MPLSPTDVLDQVKLETKRSLVAADIQNDIIAALVDISKQHGFLKTSTSGTMSSDHVDMPTGFSFADTVTVDGEPFDPITFAEYTNDVRSGYAIRGNQIFFTEDALGKAYEICYAYIHPRTVSAIEFDDKVLDAVVSFVTARVYRRAKQHDDASTWFSYYDIEIAKLIASAPFEPNVGKIRRI